MGLGYSGYRGGLGYSGLGYSGLGYSGYGGLLGSRLRASLLANRGKVQTHEEIIVDDDD